MTTRVKRDFSIGALQAKFNTNTSNTNSGNNNYYPFWEIEPGSEAIVRFLPDKNLDNTWFLQERTYHELLINGEKTRVPCLKQYGKDCPICAESAKRYKEEGDTTIIGKQLYRKKNWVAQVLVVDDPLPLNKETNSNDQGKIKLVTFTSQVYNAIKIVVESGELEIAPHAYDDGTNFAIRVTMNGKYRDYSKSNFVRKSTSLTDEQVDWIEENLIDLSTLVPNEPDLDFVNRTLDTFLNGGLSIPVETTSSSLVMPSYDKPVERPAESVMSILKPEASGSGEDDEAEAILATLRANRAKKTDM